MRRDVLTGSYFTLGDIACAEGALAAGCKYFAGYPITPATEIAEHMARRMPEVGGVYIQMEDEIASIASVIGASYSGMKAMTATSGPGFSLMQENIGLAVMTEAPLVIANVMRGGPSTGQPTKGGQQDVMQTKWGSHGDYEVIAFAPSSVQEMFDLTIEAFNCSERFRCPAFVLADENVGHLREKLVIPEPHEIKLIARKRARGDPKDYAPFRPDEDLIPPMAHFGEGFRFYATGLTHNERGLPRTVDPEVHAKLVRRLNDKIRRNAKDIIKVERLYLDDADICVIAYGIVSRSAATAVKMARGMGIKAGLLKLVTVWPFPSDEVSRLSEGIKKFLVCEMNEGQIVREVERCNKCSKVAFLPKLGGEIHTPREILSAIRGGEAR